MVNLSTNDYLWRRLRDTTRFHLGRPRPADRAATVAILVALSGTAFGGRTWFVDIDAAPGGDGTSWATAFDDLHEGLAAAVSGDEVWIAEGVYRPAPEAGDRAIVYRQPAGVALYGGFQGVETSREERDYEEHRTILSGDLNDNDRRGFLYMVENSLRVVETIASTDPLAPTRIDGLAITAGRGGRNGAGLSVTGPGSFVLANCTIVRNWSGGGAGGASISDCETSIENCVFENNIGGEESPGSGGGAAVQGAPTLDVRRSRFADNLVVGGDRDVDGGGLLIFDVREARVGGCMFTTNRSRWGGGGISAKYSDAVYLDDCDFVANAAYVEGGAVQVERVDMCELTHCRFLDNRADSLKDCYGGALYLAYGSMTARDCEFVGNMAAPPNGSTRYGAGGAVYTYSSESTIERCLFEGNRAGEFAGGLRAHGTACVVDACTFIGNESVDAGAMLASVSSSMHSDVRISGCEFRQNVATTDSVVVLYSRPGSSCRFENCDLRDNDGRAALSLEGTPITVRNVTVEDNRRAGIRTYERSTVEPPVRIEGCVIRGNGSPEPSGEEPAGGVILDRLPADFINCLIAGNGSEGGGGVWVVHATMATFTNCTIVDNFRFNGLPGGAVRADASGAAFHNCVLWNNGSDPFVGTLEIEHSVVEHGYAGVGNSDADPLFVEPAGGNWRLQMGSSAIDAANADRLPGDITADLDGSDRYVEDPGVKNRGVGKVTWLDCGAYEFAGATTPFRLLLEPETPIAGAPLTIAARNGAPGTRTWLFASVDNTGQTPVPQIQVTLGLADPRVVGDVRRTDDQGRAAWRASVPRELGHRRMWLQAAQPGVTSVVRSAEVVAP